MTVATTQNTVVVIGNGVTTTWPYPFPVPVGAIVVLFYTPVGGTTTVIQSSQYAVTGLGNPTGGTFSYPLGSGTPIAPGATLVLARYIPEVQPTSLANQGTFWPGAVEGALDYLTMMVQQVQANINSLSQFNGQAAFATLQTELAAVQTAVAALQGAGTGGTVANATFNSLNVTTDIIGYTLQLNNFGQSNNTNPHAWDLFVSGDGKLNFVDATTSVAVLELTENDAIWSVQSHVFTGAATFANGVYFGASTYFATQLQVGPFPSQSSPNPNNIQLTQNEVIWNDEVAGASWQLGYQGNDGNLYLGSQHATGGTVAAFQPDGGITFFKPVFFDSVTVQNQGQFGLGTIPIGGMIQFAQPPGLAPIYVQVVATQTSTVAPVLVDRAVPGLYNNELVWGQGTPANASVIAIGASPNEITLSMPTTAPLQVGQWIGIGSVAVVPPAWRGWIVAAGQALSTATYGGLFSVIGYDYTNTSLPSYPANFQVPSVAAVQSGTSAASNWVATLIYLGQDYVG